MKKYAKFEKNELDSFYFTTLCQKIEARSKKYFIKVVVAAFSIKSINFLVIKPFQLACRIFLSVWNVATWKAFRSINLDWKEADWLGHAKSLVG